MRRLCLPSLIALVAASATHASPVSSSGGTITFHGAVQRFTMAPSENKRGDYPDLGMTTNTLPISKARTVLSSDVLDYFASYAKPDAKLVSTTYR
jgi:hypothetical protein